MGRMRTRAIAPIFLLAAFLVGCPKPAEVPDPDAVPTATAPPPPPDLDLSRSSGLVIQSQPPTKILVDGKEVGMSPITVENLATGEHEVTFVSEDGNMTMTVELAEGQYQTVQHNFTPKASDFKPPAE